MLLLIGTLPFAVITWWTVVAPLLAMTALGFGVAVLRWAHRVRQIRAEPVSGPEVIAVVPAVGPAAIRDHGHRR